MVGMQGGYASWIYKVGIQGGYARWIHKVGMQGGYARWVCKVPYIRLVIPTMLHMLEICFEGGLKVYFKEIKEVFF